LKGAADKIRITELTLKSLEDKITEDEFRELDAYIAGSCENAAYFSGCIATYLGIQKCGDFNRRMQTGTEPFDGDLWNALARCEKTAPVIERQAGAERRGSRVEKVERKPVEYRCRKRSLISIAVLAAMLLIIIVLDRSVPMRQDDTPAAVLADSLNATWSAADRPLEKGASLAAGRGQHLLLRQGYAELLFNTNARVTVEGPAEFQILSEDAIHLNYGKFYATVPPEAIGFTVKTPSARIIDLGTEFGVEMDAQGNTFLHVLKGKTVLIAGGKNTKTSVEVKGGDAKKVLAGTQSISDIACSERLFVRTIDSDGNLAWRGETAISLADIVAGGNGFGEIKSTIGLDPGSGRYTFSILGQARRSDNKYHAVAGSRFVDGVFVPGKGADPGTTITSRHDTFQVADSSGEFSHDIAVFRGDTGHENGTLPAVIFGGRKYADNAILMIHSNAGITIDLQAIRQSVPGMDLVNFKAFGGLTEALDGVTFEWPDVDFAVLVDGQVRYEKPALTLQDNKVSFDFGLRPQDRFLTLIVTDGTRASEAPRGYAAWCNDFFCLVDPTLGLTEIGN